MIKNFCKLMGRFDPYDLTAILLSVFMVAYKIILVVSQSVDNWRGDASQRLLMANGYSQDWGKYLSGHFWSNIWPPGQFTFLGCSPSEQLYLFVLSEVIHTARWS